MQLSAIAALLDSTELFVFLLHYMIFTHFNSMFLMINLADKINIILHMLSSIKHQDWITVLDFFYWVSIKCV